MCRHPQILEWASAWLNAPCRRERPQAAKIVEIAVGDWVNATGLMTGWLGDQDSNLDNQSQCRFRAIEFKRLFLQTAPNSAQMNQWDRTGLQTAQD
jgi:hypothetical protein